MNHPPLVSVLMPTFNSEKNISSSIRSILNQSFTDFEFVIIDGGSSDQTKKIIVEFAQQDSRIKLFENPPRLDIIRSLNQGLDLCSGKYIARMDSDDLCEPDRLEKQVRFMDANPNVGVLGTYQIYFGGRDDRKSKTPKTHLAIKASLLFWATMRHPTVMIRAEVMNAYQIRYSLEHTYCEDYGMWVKFAQVTELHNLPEFLCYYRWDEEKVWETDNVALMAAYRKIIVFQLKLLFGDSLLDEDVETHLFMCGRLMGSKAPSRKTVKIWFEKVRKKNLEAGVYSDLELSKAMRRAYKAYLKRTLWWPISNAVKGFIFDSVYKLTGVNIKGYKTRAMNRIRGMLR